MEPDEKFLRYVVEQLIDYPNDLHIERTVDNMGVLLRMTLNKDDMGKVIGRAGATAKAIRTLLRTVGMRHDARVNLKIEEPTFGQERSQEAFKDAATEDESNAIDNVINDLKGGIPA